MEPEAKDHLEPEVKSVCGYCGREFEENEVVVEREIHGRKWKFCNEECIREFLDAIDFQDEPEMDGDKLPEDRDI